MWGIFGDGGFIAIYAYLGLLVGVILSKIAPEEIKPGRKYFIFGQAIVMVALFAFTYFFGLRSPDIYMFILAFVGMLLVLYDISVFLFLGMGVLFFSGGLAVVFGVLVFLYGMFASSINQDQKNYFGIVYSTLYLLLFYYFAMLCALFLPNMVFL
jgi:hypothetical protein